MASLNVQGKGGQVCDGFLEHSRKRRRAKVGVGGDLHLVGQGSSLISVTSLNPVGCDTSRGVT